MIISDHERTKRRKYEGEIRIRACRSECGVLLLFPFRAVEVSYFGNSLNVKTSIGRRTTQ